MKRVSFFLSFVFLLHSAYQKEFEIHNLHPHFQEFNKYLDYHEITLDNDSEYLLRMENYLQNKKYIEERNKAGLSFTLAMNQFGHLTNDEYRALLKTSIRERNSNISILYVPEEETVMKDIDYRDLGAVTQVKNQKNCGSCWAFSAVGCLESQYILKTKKKILLSEQQLVDCSWPEGNEGCDGGLMDSAFLYARKVGLTDSTHYPYNARNGKCRATRYPKFIRVRKIYDIKSGNEEALAYALIKHGPISVAIDASEPDFTFYSKGIYVSDKCSSEELDHGVLVVGIGSKPSDYYIVKNSWGERWGDKGYILMARNKNNMCGIATASSFATITTPSFTDE